MSVLQKHTDGSETKTVGFPVTPATLCCCCCQRQELIWYLSLWVSLTPVAAFILSLDQFTGAELTRAHRLQHELEPENILQTSFYIRGV